MDVHILSIAVLGLAFLLGLVRGINLGAAALVGGGAMVLLVTGGGVEQLYASFPADLFVLLVGVTFLFGIATVNGTIEWVVDALSRALGGRVVLIPWVLFFVAAAVTSLGALAPVVVGLVAPIGMRLATKQSINPRLAGLMILAGATAGNFSPVNLLGATVNSTLERAGLNADPITLFVSSFGYNVVLGIVIFIIFGGLKLRGQVMTVEQTETVEVREPATVGAGAHRAGAGSAGSDASSVGIGGGAATGGGTSQPDLAPVKGKEKLDAVKGFTLAVIVAVGAIAMVGKVDLGVLALSAAVLLSVLMPTSSAGASKRIAWDVVLLITGVVTYVGLLQEIGTVKFIGDAANGLGSPLLTAVVICFIGAVISAFASSAGVVAILIPLALPFLLSGDISVTGMAIAIAISSTVVDSTPFSTISAITLTNVDEDQRAYAYRGFLIWGLAMVVTAPIITMVFVLPGMA